MPLPRPTYRTSGTFAQKLRRLNVEPLSKRGVEVLQINLGDRCNQSCAHCHVEASPAGTHEMSSVIAERLVSLVDRTPDIKTVDLTGGAPELAACFPYLLREMSALGRQVLDRCNLTVLMEPGMAAIPALLCEYRAAIIASLPCYTRENVDAQRGQGVFESSIAALKMLNDFGYGLDETLPLTLVYNPGGAFLPGRQRDLEQAYRLRLKEDFGVVFTALQTMTNMPLGRFKMRMSEEDGLSGYIQSLEAGFNPDTLDRLMCRNLVSVGYDGTLYDCDFNLSAGLPISGNDGQPMSVFDIETPAELAGIPVQTDIHCFGCTGGAGSGCFGDLG